MVRRDERTQGRPEKSDEAWVGGLPLCLELSTYPWDAKSMHEIDAWLTAKFGK